MSASHLPCMRGEKALGSVPKEIRALYLLHLVSRKSKVKRYQTVKKGPGQRGVSSAHFHSDKQHPFSWERQGREWVLGLLSLAAR